MRSDNDLPLRAQRLWHECATEIGASIIHAIRTMGLPWAESADSEHAQLRATSLGEVRRALLVDTAMHADIMQEIRVALWSGARRGMLPEDDEHARRWLFLVAKRTSQRHATAHAKRLLRFVESKTAEDALAHVADRRDIESEIDARRQVERLQALIGELSESDLLVLEAKLEERYAELARALGVEEGTLRTRACRVVRMLRDRLRLR